MHLLMPMLESESLRYEVMVASLYRAAMERHHGDDGAALQQMKRWMTIAAPLVIETMVMERIFAAMSDGRVH